MSIDRAYPENPCTLVLGSVKYKDKQRDAVVETVRKDFPLNVMYWVKNENGTYEVMDGQQRTLQHPSQA